ncbi:MAG: hypothetical protein JXB14_03220 [Candidatus Altiarchaeota archaeon]|nr:hypothetical protein [Candidatus Altiarchaeota archaeon]
MECENCKKLQKENNVLRYDVMAGAVENFDDICSLKTQLEWKEDQIKKLRAQSVAQ